ncbi:MAG: hypothetical protein QOG85_152 [Gaiellaceae bacterium]|jgi:hypothetical protein|nr:hypothetical protein [Gaiellaceae bacterium]
MRARDGDPRPCTYCSTPTRFRLTLIGPRGGRLRTVDCCPQCGEEPARRERAKEARAA